MRDKKRTKKRIRPFASSPQARGVLKAYRSTTFKVIFDPSAAGVRTATIAFPTDDADENPYEFAVQGEGVAPPAAPTNISIKQ